VRLPDGLTDTHESLVAAEDAAQVQKTELALLGGAFARGGNAFTSLSRYETTLFRRREKNLQLLREAQERRAAATAITSVATAETSPTVTTPE
jgi:hypothetical protein